MSFWDCEMSEMKICRLPCGAIGTNTYIVYMDGQKGAVVIDPADAEVILDALEQRKLGCAAILVTHGHFDHISGIGGLKKAFSCPVYIGEGDAGLLGDPLHNGSLLMLGEVIKESPAENTVKDGDELAAAGMKFRVIGCPGHTPGGVGYSTAGALFSGDSLFHRGIGRTDLPGGDMDALFSAVLKLYELPEETAVFPGHGESTTIGDEAKNNPFIRRN